MTLCTSSTNYCGGRALGRFSWKQPYTTSNLHQGWPGSLNDQSSNHSAPKIGEQEVRDTETPLINPNHIQEGLQTSNQEDPERICVLGVGRYGTLFAHAIAGLPNRPPISLLLHSKAKLHEWEDNDCCTKVLYDKVGEERRNYKVELLPPGPLLKGGLPREGDQFGYPTEPNTIHQLILSVKPQFAVYALSSIADRLTQDSTILFLQNGMGVVEEVNRQMFPEEMTRPTYMVATISHQVAMIDSNPFGLNLMGMGSTALGFLPRHSMHQQRTVGRLGQVAPSARYLLRTLTRIPELAAVGFIPTDILQLQLEQLAINAIIEPLTALLECCRGEIFHERPIIRTTRLLLAEISLVIRSLPELQGVANVTMRFSPDRLEALARMFCRLTPKETSLTLQEVRAGRLSSLDYLNGYIVRRGEELGLRCTLNYLLMQMVHGKGAMQRTRNIGDLPLQREDLSYDEIS